MEKIETSLRDCYLLKPNRFGDSRGYFESITEKELTILGFNKIFQISNSLSKKGIVRGLHFQKNPYCQAKVVRCHRGGVVDVVVDLRKDSDTYLKWETFLLTPENGNLLFVPRGVAHGFVSILDDTLFEYYVDNEYCPHLEDGILWNDKEINIDWNKIFKEYDIKEPLLSDKDANRHSLKESNIDFQRENKRYLITGYRGQLGFDIKRELNERGEYNILALDRDTMDITDKKVVEKIILDYKPNVIFHCAAWTSVDKAEEEEMKDAVYKVNVEGTKNIVDAALKVNAKVIYMSTDYVFDGKKDGEYIEDDKPNPKSYYGETKYLGEEEVRRNPKHFITRISWVFGINGNNFIKTMLKLSETHDELNVVADQIGSPTYTVDLAKLLVEMAETEKYGTYNVNNEGFCSWAEFAEYIMKSNNKKTKINAVTTEEYLKITNTKQAYRPRNSKLSKNKLESNGFLRLPSWQDAVDRYIIELNEKEGIKK